MSYTPKNLIILEGPSRSGKSTLARDLVDISVNNARIVKLTAAAKYQAEEIPLRSWVIDMKRIELALEHLTAGYYNTVILDRFFLSELVYSHLRRNLRVSTPEASEWITQITILVDMAWKTLSTRLRRKDPLFVTTFVFGGKRTSKDMALLRERRKDAEDTWSLAGELHSYSNIFHAPRQEPFMRSRALSVYRFAPLLLGDIGFQRFQVIEEVKKCQQHW